MYRISEFSKITNLTVKTLRYYDEEGMLTPSHRDECNSYRYYGEADFRKAQLIAFLRELEFSILEIKDVLNQYGGEEDLSCFLEEKMNRILGNMEKERSLIKKISLHIKPKTMEESSMSEPVEILDLPAVTVASIRYKGKYSDVGKHIGTIYKAVRNNADGPPFCLYYDSEYKEDADIELCVPVKRTIEDKTVACKKLPAIRALCATHIGRYESLSLTYKALLDAAHERNLRIVTPSREVYVKGPGMVFRGNEDHYVTKIILPFEEEER
ncbi:MAG: MerR family transcriptional regulator [Bacillota bacterium]